MIAYESWCGGLPALESVDNPLGYKFSWNPGAGIKAAFNMATFVLDGKIVNEPHPLRSAKEITHLSQTMLLQGYPNRDSTKF